MARTVGRGLVAVLLATLAGVTGCDGPSDGPGPAGSSSPAVAAPTSPPRLAGGLRTTGRGPEQPDRGVWLGAWVKPDWPTPAGRAAALVDFGRQTGGRLAISHMFHDWQDEFPGPTEEALRPLDTLQLISWSGTDTRSIASGVYDELIRRRAQEIKEYGVPVLLRWRWEMDRPNLAASVHSPADYVAAWRHLRAIFTEVGALNAGWVWCPHVRGFVEAKRAAAAYYPGDDQVDWLCTDVYPGQDFEGFAPQMDAFMAFAAAHPRPVLIGEYGVTTAGRPGQRGAWLREARRYAKAHPQIKAMVYYAGKQTKPAYDSTFDADPEGLAAFRELTADPYFQAPLPSEPAPSAVPSPS